MKRGGNPSGTKVESMVKTVFATYSIESATGFKNEGMSIFTSNEI